MSGTLLERSRILHAEIEGLKASMVQDLQTQCKGHSRILAQDHRVAARIRKIQQNTRELLKIYKDTDARRSAELKEISGRSCLATFREKIKELNRYHKKQKIANEYILTEEADVDPQVNWAGDEMGGRFLDMHSLHAAYLNLPHFRKGKKEDKIDYKEFMDRLFNFRRVKIQFKDKRYLDYYKKVLEYLVAFWDRTRPLTTASKIIPKVKEEFEPKWEAKQVTGWHLPWPSVIDDDDEDMDHSNSPLWCKVSCRMFTNYNVMENFQKGKRYKRLKNRMGCDDKWSRDIAYTELLVDTFARLLGGNIEATKEYVEKKQTRTYKEIKEALIEAEKESEPEDESDDDDPYKDGTIYNPLKIPLDFDGKPIPYWLYKFRGLNRYFVCEICGGYQYRGPRAFNRHFREWRHAHGMRCLGIPNTKDFHLITMINDAIALYDKIKQVKSKSAYRPDEEEEFEDINGTVFRKRDYDRLVRQGVL